MKTICTPVVFFLLLNFSFSQTENKPEHNHEFGINATRFINAFVSFNDNSVGTNNYLITYKKIKDNGTAFRMGGGLFGNSSVDNPDDDNSNFEKRTVNVFDLDLRIGTEKQIPIFKRWSVNAGFDGIGGYRFDSVNTDDNKVKENSFYLGIGPILGIQYMINDRIGLLTEGAYYLSFSSSVEKSEFEDGSFSDDTTDKQSSIFFGTTLPSNIIFFIRF